MRWARRVTGARIRGSVIRPLVSLIKKFLCDESQVSSGEILLVVPGVEGGFSSSDGFGERQV
jgi:hypothetical protein